MIELITGLHPVVAREVVDESLYEELPQFIEQYYNGEAALPHASAAAVKVAQTALKCAWPAGPLREMSTLAAKCVRLQVRLRCTIADILPELEKLGAESGAAAANVQ